MKLFFLGAMEIATLLREKNFRVHSLFLSGNPISDKGALSLAGSVMSREEGFPLRVWLKDSKVTREIVSSLEEATRKRIRF